jgi:hypothetical protein
MAFPANEKGGPSPLSRVESDHPLLYPLVNESVIGAWERKNGAEICVGDGRPGSGVCVFFFRSLRNQQRVCPRPLSRVVGDPYPHGLRKTGNVIGAWENIGAEICVGDACPGSCACVSFFRDLRNPWRACLRPLSCVVGDPYPLRPRKTGSVIGGWETRSNAEICVDDVYPGCACGACAFFDHGLQSPRMSASGVCAFAVRALRILQTLTSHVCVSATSESVRRDAGDVVKAYHHLHDGGVRENTSRRLSLTSFPPCPSPHPHPVCRPHLHYPTTSSPTSAPCACPPHAHRLDPGGTIASACARPQRLPPPSPCAPAFPAPRVLALFPARLEPGLGERSCCDRLCFG